MAARGWRERVEPGLYRSHRLACRSSSDRKENRRCECPYEIVVPGARVGSTRTLTIYGPVGDARAQRRHLLAEGRPEPEAPAIEVGTLEDFAAAYFRAKAPVLSSETIRNRDDDYRLRIGPKLGDLLLDEITREKVNVWVADLVAAASSRRMIVQTMATLRVILATAVEWGRIAENPAARVRIPPPDTHEVQAVERVIDAKVMAQLFAAAGADPDQNNQKVTARTETMLRAAGEAGLRRGEVAGLKWTDVDLANRRLDVRRSVVQERATEDSAMRKVEKPPKGRRSRPAAISATFAARLADWFAESVVEGGADAQGFVWPGKDGGPMHDRSLARALERACRRIGLGETYIAQTKEGPQERFRAFLTPHGLRHSAASIMLGAGVPLIVVSRQLGHANPNITATIYAHLLGDRQLDAAAAVFDGLQAAETLEETLEEQASAD